MKSSPLPPYNTPRYDGDSATEASSSPALPLADSQLLGGSLPQTPELWADFMYSDYPYDPTTACGLLPVTSSPHGIFGDTTTADQLSFGLDPLLMPQSGLPDIDFSAEELIPAMSEPGLVSTTVMASMLPLDLDHLHSSLSPRVDQRRLKPKLAPTQRARQRGQSVSTEESGGVDRSSSPALEEERLQERRRRNKLASRKLRQKHLDQVSDLQSRLGMVTQERDELRLRVAKWEGEVMALRKLLDNWANE